MNMMLKTLKLKITANIQG